MFLALSKKCKTLEFKMSGMPHISLAAEEVLRIGPLPITNSLLTTWWVMGGLIVFSALATAKVSLIPQPIQSLVEIVLEGLFSLFKSITKEKTREFFPLLATLFIYIILANWVELLPGIGTIGIYKGEEGHQQLIPLFRGATADLNTTLALAISAVLAIQYYGIKTLGARLYIKRFLNFSNPISLFVGLLEIVSEFAKILSFAFRLFGNIFAGEVLLTVVAFLMPLFAPLPFIGLELFVGTIQALVFSMLTAVFLSSATSEVEH